MNVFHPMKPWEDFAGTRTNPALLLAKEVLGITTAQTSAGLPQKLNCLADHIAGLSGINGAVVIAFDEENIPLTCGSRNLALQGDDPDSQLANLVRIRDAISKKLKPAWSRIDTSFFQVSNLTEVIALPVRCHGVVWGLIVAVPGQEDSTNETLAALQEAGEILATAIQTAIRMEAWSRIEKLQELARKEFEAKKLNLEGIVDKLAALYEAGVATLFLEDQDELRLAASTDKKLGDAGHVVYRSGQGLTGHVFKENRAIRLRSTADREEIRQVTGLEREGPVHPEHDGENWFLGQFLAVPLRYGKRVVGVLRMSRRGSETRFTVNDEKSLQFFADLLAIDLARSRDILLMRSMLESTSEAIAVSKREPDEQGGTWPKIIMVNPGTEKLVGMSRSDILGHDARDLYGPGAYEKLQGGLESALEDLKKNNREFNEHGPVETQISRSDGSLKTVEISYRILANRMAHPPTLFTIGIARDTSDRRRFLDLSEAMGIVYFRADKNGITLESTPNESKVTGYSDEELRSSSRERLYADPLEREKLLAKLRDRPDGQLKGQVITLKRRDESVFQVEVDLRVLRDPQGSEIGIEGFYKDVSDRVQLQGFVGADTRRVLAEEELFTQLKQHAEFHRNYTISLGHQLQTPLGALVENLRNFEQNLNNSLFAKERLPYVIGQAIVCTRLVRNLSYMDKILRGEPFRRENLSLRKLAIETKLDFQHLLKEKNLELTIDDASIERYLQIQGSRELLRQVLVNLVDNAIKYSLPYTTIHIRAQQWPSGNILEVSNQGLPIPPELRERVFERGFRTDRAKALVPHGTGLGLWLVRKILEAHDAKIRCNEIQEQGQTRIVFHITFPYKTFPHKTAKPRRAA